MDKVKIKQFRNKAKEPVAGLTPEHAIYDKKGVRLDAKLGNVNLQEFRDLQKQGTDAIKQQQQDSENYINDVVENAKGIIDQKHEETAALSQASMIGSNTEGLEGSNVQENLNDVGEKLSELDEEVINIKKNCAGVIKNVYEIEKPTQEDVDRYNKCINAQGDVYDCPKFSITLPITLKRGNILISTLSGNQLSMLSEYDSDTKKYISIKYVDGGPYTKDIVYKTKKDMQVVLCGVTDVMTSYTIYDTSTLEKPVSVKEFDKEIKEKAISISSKSEEVIIKDKYLTRSFGGNAFEAAWKGYFYTKALFLTKGTIVRYSVRREGTSVIAKCKQEGVFPYTTIVSNDNTDGSEENWVCPESGLYSFSGILDDSMIVIIGDAGIKQRIENLEAHNDLNKKDIEKIYELLPTSTGGLIEYQLDIIRGRGREVSPNGVITEYNNYSISEPIFLKKGESIEGNVFVVGAASLCEFNGYDFGTILSVLSTNAHFSYIADRDISVVVSGQTNTLTTVIINKLPEKVSAASKSEVGNIENLHTKAKDNAVDAINEVHGSINTAESIISKKQLISISVGANEVRDDIPDYFFAPVDNDGLSYGNYLDDKIDSVPQGESFIFITDVHHSTNFKHSSALIDYVRRRLGIKTILHGGDVENESTVMTDAAKQWLDFNKDFVFRIGTDFKQVCGDHDHNARGANPSQIFPYHFVQRMMNGYNIHELVYNTLYDDIIKDKGWNDLELKEYDAWKKMHYYFDDRTINTRFIVLHTEWMAKETGLIHDKIGDCPYLTLQMDFLYKALTSCPNGYNVVVAGHNTIINQDTQISGELRYYKDKLRYNGIYWRTVSQFILSYKTKTLATHIPYRDWSRTYNGYDDNDYKDYDFRNSSKPNKVIIIGGDVHWDILAKTVKDDWQPTVVKNGDSISSEEVLQVVSTADGIDRAYKDVDGNNLTPLAEQGTITEQSFDIVTFTDKGVSFTRIGAGEDRFVLIK